MLVSDRPSRTKRLSAQRRISRFEGGSASARRNAVARIATPWLATANRVSSDLNGPCARWGDERCRRVPTRWSPRSSPTAPPSGSAPRVPDAPPLLTLYDHVQEVRRALGRSHSLAYEHLRRAAGREPTARAACLQPTRHVGAVREGERPARHPEHEVPRPLGRRARRPPARRRRSRSRSHANRDADRRAAAPPPALARDRARAPRRRGRGAHAVLLRGTKRKTRFRTVPIVSPAQHSLLAYALEHAKGAGEARFERCSPNDLRCTFASWQVEAGVPLFPIAQAMGHKDTRMLERVYGRQMPEQLAVLMARAMGLTERAAPPAGCSRFVAATMESAGSSGPDGLGAAATTADDSEPESSEAQRTLQSTGPLDVGRVEVPGPGIEPGTRGFSVPCSTI